MGAEHSIPLSQRRTQGSPIDSLFERAVLDALREIADESSVPSEQIEHAWDPEDCSPRFRVLSDRLTARRLPSPLTTDGIRGKKGYREGRHVWEITWERDERGSYAVIGIAHPQAPLQCLGYLPLIGSNSESWGWNLSNKVTFHDGKASTYPVNNPGLFVPDTVYCILDMDNLTLSFATETTYLGVAFRNLPRDREKPLCPCASAVYGNCDIKMRYMGRGDAFIAKLEASKEKASQPPTSLAVKPPPELPGPKSPLQSPSSSESYKFSQNCGDNIAMMLGGKKARRIDALQNLNHGVVMTVQPLKDDELFEVRLDSKVPKWFGTLDIGATTVSPEGLEFPPSMDRFRQGVTFALCENKILKNGNEMTEISKDLNDLTVGDRVGVMRKLDNSLHFFINGINVGKQVKTLPPVLYGVVDVFGQAEEVTITGGTAETQSSNQDGVDSVSVMVRMNNIINIIKDGKFNDLLFVVRKVAKDILEPFSETDDRQLRIKYGDHLSDIGAPMYLTMLLRRVMDMGMETHSGGLGMCVIRSVFWNCADASLKMARGLGRSGALTIMLNDLDTFGPYSSIDEKKKFLVFSTMSILHNCSKAAENRQILLNLRAIERISPFLRADDVEIVMAAILTLAHISSDDQKKRLEAESRVIGYLIGMLRDALNQSDLRVRSDGGTWSAQEIAEGLGNLVVNEKNMEVMLERDVVSLMISLLAKGGDTEKECAANTLWIIAKTSKGKAKIKETAAATEELTRLSKSSNQSVQAAAKRVLLKLKETTYTQGAANKQPRTRCDYQEKCRTFKSSLKLSDEFFNPEFDRCFCTECHAARGDNLYYTRGQPAKDYGIPIGWCRLGLMHHRIKRSINDGDISTGEEIVTGLRFLFENYKPHSCRPFIGWAWVRAVQYLMFLHQDLNGWRKNPQWSFACYLALLLPLKYLQEEIRGMVGTSLPKAQLDTGMMEKPSVAACAEDTVALSFDLSRKNGVLRDDKNSAESNKENQEVIMHSDEKYHRTQTEICMWSTPHFNDH